MERLVSIIIPVYNVQNELKSCVDSVISQTYKNIEIIIIDDGSTDESAKICDNYEKKDNRIKVIHKLNGGLSDARNWGLECARGEPEYFLDSDDLIKVDTIELLVCYCEKYDAEIGISWFCSFYSDSQLNNLLISCGNKDIEIMSKKEAIKKMILPGNYDHSGCGKLYKRSLWKDVAFPKGKLYEDLYTTYDLFYKANKVIYLLEPKYLYRQRIGSIMNSKIDVKHLELLDISDMVSDKLVNWYPEFKEIIRNKQTQTYANLLFKIMNYDRKTYKETQKRIVSLCRKNVVKCCCSPYMKINDKLKIILISLNKSIYPFFYKIAIKKNMKGEIYDS